jgi:hypothetical protein
MKYPQFRFATIGRGLAVVGACIALGNALGGCATHERVVVRETVAVRPEQVRYAPAPLHEDRGVAPGYGWSWLPGHWRWEGADWVWIHGKWIQQAVPPMPPVIVEQITVSPSPHHYWVPGHWVWRIESGGWVWIHGGWHR